MDVNNSLPFNSRDIEKKADEMNLRRAARHIEGAGRGIYVLRSLDVSLNPVAKLDIPFYIEEQQVPQQVSLDKEGVKKNILKVSHVVVKTIDRKGFTGAKWRSVNQEIELLFQPVLQAIDDEQNDYLGDGSMEKIRGALDALQARIDNDEFGNDDKVEEFLVNSLSLLRENVNAISTSVSLRNVKVLYDKSEVIEVLKNLLHENNEHIEKNNVEEDEVQQYLKDSDAVVEVIKTLKQDNIDPLIEWDAIRKAAKPLQKHKIIRDLDYLLHCLTPLVSSVDVIAQNNFNPVVEKALTDKAKGVFDVQSYAYKTGVENTRELLGQEILESVGLGDYVLPKINQPLKRAELKEIRDPEGIASKWVEGKKYGQSGDLWASWSRARFQYLQAVAGAEKNMKDLEEKIMKEGGLESIAQHCLMDIIFVAGDSHINQYLVGDNGELYNFDWANFLPPHPSYKAEDETFFSFRSVFLDHPISFQSMNDESGVAFSILSKLRDDVLSWDVDEIAAKWQSQGLVGRKESFEQAAREFSDIEKLRNRKERDEREINLKKQCFSQIAPDALEQWKTRMKKMQDYLEKAESPTLRGAWEAYYPEFVVFYEAVEKMIANPGENFLVHAVTRSDITRNRKRIKNLHAELNGQSPSKPKSSLLFPRHLEKHFVIKKPLELTILDAREKKAVSPEKIEEMKRALMSIRNECSSSEVARTALDV